MINQDSSNKLTDLSIDAERLIARSFMGRIEWEMIVIGLGQLFFWFGLWYLVIQGFIPLWAGFILSIISTSFSYLPSHAGQHGHLAGKNKSLKWLNAFVGQLSLIPLAQSHHILKALHMKHHAHTNNPDKDPDYFHTHVDKWWQAALKTHGQTNGGNSRLQAMLEMYTAKDANFKADIEKGTPYALTFFFGQMLVAFYFPLETLFLWWLPRKIITSYLGIIFSHEPHKVLPQGRYKDTKFWVNGIPRFFNHSMQIHVMHHMYPNICHFDEPKAIEALKPFMIERGIPGAEDLPDKISYKLLSYK